MTDLERSLLNFLKKQNNPISIGTINKEPNFSNYNRREISVALRALAAGGYAYKSLKDGVALYSTDPDSGEGANSNQSFMLGFSKIGTVNIRTAEDDEEEETAKTPDSVFDEKIEFEKKDTIGQEQLSLTYAENTRISLDQYSIAIPDGFQYAFNEDGRDFVAWRGDSYLSSEIGFYAGDFMPDIKLDMPNNWPVLPEMGAAVASAFVWTSKSLMPTLFDKEFYIPLDGGGPRGGINGAYDNNTNTFHYYFYVWFPDGLKSMRAQIDNVTFKQKADCDQIAVNWINSMVLANPFPSYNSVLDESFFEGKFSKKKAKEWIDCLNLHTYNIDQVLTQKTNAWNAKMKYEISNDKIRGTEVQLTRKLKDGCNDILRECAEMDKKLCAQAVQAFDKFCELYPESPYLLDLYNEILDYIQLYNDDKSRKIYFDQIVLSEKNPLIEYEKRILTEPVKKLLDEKKKADMEKKEEKRLKEEEKKKQEIEAARALEKAALEKEEHFKLVKKELSQMETSYKKDLEATINRVLSEYHEKTSMLLQKQEKLQNEMESLGFFKFAERKALRQKIKQLKNIIKLKQAPQTVSMMNDEMNRLVVKLCKNHSKIIKERLNSQFPNLGTKKDAISKKEKIQAEILNTLMQNPNGLTITGIIENNDYLKKVKASTREVSEIVRQMYHNLIVIREEVYGMAYFKVESFSIDYAKEIQKKVDDAEKKHQLSMYDENTAVASQPYPTPSVTPDEFYKECSKYLHDGFDVLSDA